MRMDSLLVRLYVTCIAILFRDAKVTHFRDTRKRCKGTNKSANNKQLNENNDKFYEI